MKWWRSSSGRLICVYVTNQVLPSMKTDPTELSARDWNKIGRNARNNFDSCAALLTSFEAVKKKNVRKMRRGEAEGMSWASPVSADASAGTNRHTVDWNVTDFSFIGRKNFSFNGQRGGHFNGCVFFFWVPRWNLAAIVHDICRWSRHTLSLAVPNVQSSLTWHVAP